MKKLLAMVLALVMTLSLAVSANAAFKDDKSISDDYAEAVAVLNGMGVFKGYEDGSFKPEGNITRAEVATIIYRIYTADVAKNDKSGLYATYNKFSDMAGAGWAQGYIGYCANASLVKGYPDGTFKPSGKVTGYEVLAMILRAVGYDKNNEFSGADWALHVAQTAQQLGVLDNVAKTTDLNAPASRELVAELLFQGIQKAQVTYTPAFGYVTDKVISTKTNSLGEKNFKLASAVAADKWGRPATKWTYNVGDKSTLVVAKADASYTTKVDECDIAKDLGIATTKDLEGAYIDGYSYAKNLTSELVSSNRYASINPLATKSFVGAQGRLTEVYDMGSTGYRFVEINTYLAKVTKVTAASTDRNGHVTDATVDLKVYQVNDTGIDKAGVEAEGFTVGQYVLVTMTVDTASPVVQAVEAAAVTPMGQLKNWSYAYGTPAATTTLADTSTTMLTSSMSVTSRVPPTLLPLGIPSLTLMPTGLVWSLPLLTTLWSKRFLGSTTTALLLAARLLRTSFLLMVPRLLVLRLLRSIMLSPRTTIPALWKFSLRRLLMTTPTTMPTTTASSPTP